MEIAAVRSCCRMLLSLDFPIFFQLLCRVVTSLSVSPAQRQWRGLRFVFGVSQLGNTARKFPDSNSKKASDPLSGRRDQRSEVLCAWRSVWFLGCPGTEQKPPPPPPSLQAAKMGETSGFLYCLTPRSSFCCCDGATSPQPSFA